MHIIVIILLLGQFTFGYSQNREVFVVVQDNKFFQITIDPLFQDTFTFTKYWDYQAKIYKKDGRLYDALTDSLAKPGDTTHFFHAANILLNKSYEIKYAFARTYRDSLSLRFGEMDDLNPSLLKFYLTLVGGEFRVDSVYMPLRIQYRHSFQIKSAKLKMKKLPTLADSVVCGYLDIIMLQKIFIADEIRERERVIKGYFKIPITERKITAANMGFSAMLAVE